MTQKISVLDHGHIMLIDSMGNDTSILQAARTSYQHGTKILSDDRTLLRMLLRNDHASPFEAVVLKFHVKLPIFVERQWARHRTAGWNEVSARYSVLPEETYVPSRENVKAQSKSNKQGRDQDLPDDVIDDYLEGIQSSAALAFHDYHISLEQDVSRELARIELPLSTYTEKVWWCNLRNIFNFLRLRMDSHAQYEIREYANAMAKLVKIACPIAYEAFEDYVLYGCRFSRMEMKLIRGFTGVIKNCDNNPTTGMTDREWREFKAKLL